MAFVHESELHEAKVSRGSSPPQSGGGRLWSQSVRPPVDRRSPERGFASSRRPPRTRRGSLGTPSPCTALPPFD